MRETFKEEIDMIQKVEMYQAACDRCGKTLKNKCEDTLRTYFPHSLYQIAVIQKWIIANQYIYCPDCVEWDEETKSYKPKENSVQ